MCSLPSRPETRRTRRSRGRSLEVSTAAADAYLTVLVAGQTKQAAQAAVDNWETLRQSVHALTSAELRPGADESRIDAEKAVAMTQLALAQEAVEMSRATLAKFLMKTSDSGSELASSQALSRLPTIVDEAVPFQPAGNPIMAEEKAAVAQSAAQLSATARS
jgi:outer membrane protein